MQLPYEKARAGDRALIEVQKTLEQIGCASFGTMTDAERGVLIVQFRYNFREISLEASWKGYAAAWKRAHPYSTARRISPTDYDRKALQIAKTAVCSALRDWIKGQMTAIECGILSFDAVFMPYMLLSDGQRVVDRARELLPPPAERKVVEFKP